MHRHSGCSTEPDAAASQEEDLVPLPSNTSPGMEFSNLLQSPAGNNHLKPPGQVSSCPLPSPEQCSPNPGTAHTTTPEPAHRNANPPSSLPRLPNFIPTEEPCFSWGSLDSESFIHSLAATYAEVVHWRRNCFKVPFGNAGKSFVTELARLFKAFAEKSSLESVALKAAIVLPILALQKPTRTSKAKDHIACLEKRLSLWREGLLNDLVIEGRAIQKRLPKQHPSQQRQQLARAFANLMAAGNTKAALWLITEQSKGEVLCLDEIITSPDGSSQTVKEILESKHPPPDYLPIRNAS